MFKIWIPDPFLTMQIMGKLSGEGCLPFPLFSFTIISTRHFSSYHLALGPRRSPRDQTEGPGPVGIYLFSIRPRQYELPGPDLFPIFVAGFRVPGVGHGGESFSLHLQHLRGGHRGCTCAHWSLGGACPSTKGHKEVSGRRYGWSGDRQRSVRPGGHAWKQQKGCISNA